MQLIRPSVLKSRQAKWNGRNPRLYDIRHTFACNVIMRWRNEGVDINNKMVYLSAYLGHIKPSDIYWYLTGTPELLNATANIFEEFYLGGGKIDK